MAKRDYYEVLGLAKNASDDEIKKAYVSCELSVCMLRVCGTVCILELHATELSSSVHEPKFTAATVFVAHAPLPSPSSAGTDRRP